MQIKITNFFTLILYLTLHYTFAQALLISYTYSMEHDPKAHFFLGLMLIAILFITVSGPLYDPRNATLLLAQVLGTILIIWSLITKKIKHTHHHKLPSGYFFTTQGPYEIIRHPIYAGIILLVSSLIEYAFTPIRVFAFLLLLIGIAMKILREEQTLLQKIPEYKEYKKKTKALIPYLL